MKNNLAADAECIFSDGFGWFCGVVSAEEDYVCVVFEVGGGNCEVWRFAVRRGENCFAV
jgi:hypothetical protein